MSFQSPPLLGRQNSAVKGWPFCWPFREGAAGTRVRVRRSTDPSILHAVHDSAPQAYTAAPGAGLRARTRRVFVWSCASKKHLTSANNKSKERAWCVCVCLCVCVCVCLGGKSGGGWWAKQRAVDRKPKTSIGPQFAPKRALLPLAVAIETRQPDRKIVHMLSFRSGRARVRLE